MEFGMLNPFHNEEGQFGIDRDHQENSPWGSDHDVHGNHLTSDVKEEDFRRTLHDWRQHVDAFPMPDTDDYIPNEVLPADIFEQTPSPSKTKEFCFMPQNLNNSMNDITSPQGTLSKGGYSYMVNQTHHNYTSQLRGDNRLMDNDNTSLKRETFPCSTDDEESDISECDPGMDILSNGYQIIPVNPDMDLSSDSSVKSDSRSSTPDNYSSGDSLCPELQHALQKSIAGKVQVNNEEQYYPESNDEQPFPALPVSSIMEYRIQKTPENIRFNKLFALNSPGQHRRQNKKSMSLPQSPKHVPHTPSELDGLDLHTSMSFEDMKLDFSEFVNVSPNSSFVKKFDMCEVFDAPVIPFSDARNFIPKCEHELKPTDLGVSKISDDDKCKSIHSNPNDILSIIEKSAINEHELNTSDILFPCRMDDLEVGDMNNFDLPSFIMDDLHVDSTGLLKDSLECSPIICTNKSTKYTSEIENLTDFHHIVDSNEEKQTRIIVSTPKVKTQTFCTTDDNFQDYQNSETCTLETSLTMGSQKSYPMETITCNGEVISIVSSNSGIPYVSVAENSKDDTEDFVDVETVDEGDGLTVLAASNVDSLWEQFEATEELNIINRPPAGSLVNSHSPNVFDKATEALSLQDKNQLATLDGKKALPWSLPIRPYMIIPGMSKNKWQESPTKQQPKPEIVSPILLVKDHSSSLHNTSNKSVHLDHDYCSPIRIKHCNQSVTSNGHDESETDDPNCGHFVSPNRQDITNLSSVYKMLNASKQKLGLGKGKSISMCISRDVNTDEFVENIDESPSSIKPPRSSNQTFKNVRLTPFKSDSTSYNRHSDMSDSDCSMSDHSYSKTDFSKRMPEYKNHDSANGEDFDDNRMYKKNLSLLTKDQIYEMPKLNVCDKKTNFDETNSRNAQNLIALKNGSERLTEMNKTSNNSVNKNISFTKGNKNSLLINNINKNYNGKGSVVKKLALNVNDKVHPVRQKQSLLKPTVRNEIKMVSLLKSNNVVINDSEKTILTPKPEQLTAVSRTADSFETIVTSDDVELELPSSVIAVNKVLTDVDRSVVPESEENIQQSNAEKLDKKLPLKRKLNLEEYKKRRGNSTRSCETSRTCSPIICNQDNLTFSSPNSPAPAAETIAKPVKLVEPPPSLTEMLQNVLSNSKHPQKQSEIPATPLEVKEEDRDAKPSNSDKKIFNPIVDASKKALQLKKIAALRSKDNKIPKVTTNTILPIATENGKILSMTKNVDQIESDLTTVPPVRRKNSDYEEIIMFSVGVNTIPVMIIDEDVESVTQMTESQNAEKSDVSKPSIQFKIKQNKTKIVMQKNVFDENIATGSDQIKASNTDCSEIVTHTETQKKVSKDIKPSKIIQDLESINATLEKVERRKDLKITSNSLIASIQDVVHKKNSKNRSPDDSSDSLLHKTGHTATKLINKNKEADKNVVTSKVKESTDRSASENMKDVLDSQNIKKSPTDLIRNVTDVKIVKELIKDSYITEDTKCVSVLKSDHGEDKVIMHLKKGRVRPDVCTLAIQTDFKIVIKDIVPEDIDHVIKDEDVIEFHDDSVEMIGFSSDSIIKHDDKKDIKSELKSDTKCDKSKSIENVKKIQPDRSYRRKDSLSSETSTENSDVINKRKERRSSRDHYDNLRKTNSREKYHRMSRSPGSNRKSENRSRSWGRYNRYSNRINRWQDPHYGRRSRSISRDRRKQNNSRNRTSYRTYSSTQNDNRDRSRSKRNDRDDKSFRSVNSTCSKRKRLVSRSSLERPNSHSHATKKSARELERTSISLDRADYSSHGREIQKSNGNSYVTLGEERNVSLSKENMRSVNKPDRSRRRKSTECSNASYASQVTKSGSRYSSDSEDNSSSSGSSSSSSSSDSSSDSDSSDSNSDRKFNSVDTRKQSALHRYKSGLIEERRQVFVGKLESDLTKSEFEMKFIKYGQITEVTMHKKVDGSRYGFVTFGQAEQAYRVVERAKSDADLQRYDIFFGGRRQFCQQQYSDLDDLEAVEDTEYFLAMAPRPAASSFDILLDEMRATLAKKGIDPNNRFQTGQGPRSGHPRTESHCKV